MFIQPELNPQPEETTARRGLLFLRKKLAKLLPPMWYNNHLDTHHIIRDRSWFLRENRFLFFTRNGPVEITLKPTTVFASAIICMVGVSVIFLSTIFASYSAIEVMRDESIQTAEASVTLTNNNSRRTTIMAPGDTNDGDTVTWQDEFTPQNDTSDLNGMIAGKTAASPKPLLSRFNTQPQINAPSIRELFGNTALDRLPTLPKITNDDKQDIHQAITSPKILSPQIMPLDHKETNIAAPALPDDKLQSGEPIKDLALATIPARKLPRTNTSANEMPVQPLNQIADGMEVDALPLTLPETNSDEYASTEQENEDSAFRSAAGFAIAMLPRLFSDPDSVPEPKQFKTLPRANTADDPASGPLDDGFAITASGRVGPLLPSISDAARAQKMFLSLDSEINYIRKSISQLGIKTDYLPRYDNGKNRHQRHRFQTIADHFG